MRVLRVRRFGEDPTTTAGSDQVNVSVKPSTITSGLALWVTAGVVTHLAIRFIDGWLDRPRRK